MSRDTAEHCAHIIRERFFQMHYAGKVFLTEHAFYVSVQTHAYSSVEIDLFEIDIDTKYNWSKLYNDLTEYLFEMFGPNSKTIDINFIEEK